MSSYYPLVIYSVAAAFLFFMYISCFHCSRKVQLTITIVLALVYVVRFTIGNDFINYKYIYNNIFNSAIAVMKDPFQYGSLYSVRNLGYTFFVYGLKHLFCTYPEFILALNILTMTLLMIPVLRQSRQPLFSMVILIGCGVLEMYYGSAWREFLAMCIFFAAFYFCIPKKKYLAYELCILLAFTFHESAGIGFFVPVVIELYHRHSKKAKKIYFWILVISAAIGILNLTLVPYLATMPTFQRYIAFSYFIQNPDFSIIGLLLQVCLGIAVYILYSWSNPEDLFLKEQTAVFLMTVPFYFCFAGFQLVSRVADFIQIIEVILIPNLVCLIPDKKKKALGFLGVIALNFVLLYSDTTYRIGNTKKIYEIVNAPVNSYISVWDPAADIISDHY
ncbi:EpsG family protein [Galactobacillus timonensis]|uniref:EpsG family protein n=1 Tax=Galactobacillus timonensis TaxID=2041840 RepID=UPI000C82AAFB|nr:EpsG family protein [Galactobacillus timonensis]